jgi:peptidoglycan/xylan/chitin deacetylase (PgdA/CDA1 family)
VKVPVITYHDVYAGNQEEMLYTPIDRLYSISAAGLEEQAAFLSSNVYRALGLEEFISWKEGLVLPGQKPVLLTFDDGLLSNYTLSFPILTLYGLPAVYFITAGKVEQPGYVSWRHLSEIARAGNAIGSHGLTHSVLKNMGRSGVRTELETSRKLLEDRIGVPVKTLSIPRGFYDETVIEVARESGYSSVFTSDTGYNNNMTDMFSLRRIVMRNDYTFKDFKDIVKCSMRFRAARWVEWMAKTLIQKTLGVERYDRLKTAFLTRKGI